MRSLKPLAIAGLATLALGNLALPAFAQPGSNNAPPPVNGQPPMPGPGMHPNMGHPNFGPGNMGQHRMMRPGVGHGGMLGLDGFTQLACTERGAEALEIMFVRLSYRLDLTAAQKPLLDELRTSALSAQQNFADTCQAVRGTAGRPQASGNANRPTPPDLVTQLKNRVALETARLDAVNTVLPKLEAFYTSLTDQQKSQLRPSMRGGKGGPNGHWGPNMGNQPPKKGSNGKHDNQIGQGGKFHMHFGPRPGADAPVPPTPPAPPAAPPAMPDAPAPNAPAAPGGAQG